MFENGSCTGLLPPAKAQTTPSPPGLGAPAAGAATGVGTAMAPCKRTTPGSPSAMTRKLAGSAPSQKLRKSYMCVHIKVRCAAILRVCWII